MTWRKREIMDMARQVGYNSFEALKWEQTLTDFAALVREEQQTEVQRLIALVRAQQITIDKLEAALEQPAPVQEPVAWMHVMDNTEGLKANGTGIVSITQKKKHPFGKAGVDFSKSYPVKSTPLYTTPPQRTWVGSGDLEDSNAYQTPTAAQPAPVKWSDYEPDGMHHTTPPQRIEQEPVAFPRQAGDSTWIIDTAFIWRVKHTIDPNTPYDWTPSEEQIETVLLALEKIPSPLYTTPPQRTWVGITDEERNTITRHHAYVDNIIKATEAKLKEKNT